MQLYICVCLVKRCLSGYFRRADCLCESFASGLVLLLCELLSKRRLHLVQKSG